MCAHFSDAVLALKEISCRGTCKWAHLRALDVSCTGPQAGACTADLASAYRLHLRGLPTCCSSDTNKAAPGSVHRAVLSSDTVLQAQAATADALCLRQGPSSGPAGTTWDPSDARAWGERQLVHTVLSKGVDGDKACAETIDGMTGEVSDGVRADLGLNITGVLWVAVDCGHLRERLSPVRNACRSAGRPHVRQCHGHQVSSSSRLSKRLTILNSHSFGHLHLGATCPHESACLDGGWDVLKAADGHIKAKLDSQFMLAAPAGISGGGSGELWSTTMPPQMSADLRSQGSCPSCTD